MEDLLTKAIIKLFDTERFYAEVVVAMDRIISNKVPTAGVCIKDKIQLYVNPEFFSKLSVNEQVAILKHECQHILNDHIARAKEIAPEVYAKTGDKDVVDALINGDKHMLLNVAADCAINSGIADLPDFACTPEKFELAKGQTMEWYLENLKNNKKAKNITEFDEHSLWSESEGSKEELKEKLRQHVNRAAQNTRAAGRMTADNELLVDKVNYKARDWKGDLRRFVARNLTTSLESSKKKRNRRYGITIPGYVKNEELHIGVAIDTSGSISDEQLNQFMAEIGNIAKYALVTVVEADSEVKNSYVYDPKKQYTIKGRGGTAYAPALDYFTKETEVDGVIYFGDMDTCDSEELKQPKYPVLWAVVGTQKPPATWGSVTRVEVKSENR